MSETFEIGVTLALNDGVSDGITRARKEMAAFERVLMTGGVSVSQLRKVAREAGGPPQDAGVQRPEARPETTIPRDGSMPETALGATLPVPSLPKEWPESRQQPGFGADEPDNITELKSISRAVSEPPMQVPNAAPVTYHSAPLQGSPDIEPTLITHDFKHNLIPVDLARPVPMPMPNLNAPDPQRVDRFRPLVAAAAPSEFMTGLLTQTPSSGGDDRAAPSAFSPPSSDINLERDSPPYGPSPVAPFATPDAGAARYDIWQVDSPPPPHVAPAAPAASEINATNPSNSGSLTPPASRLAPSEGDVFLDGTLVGRWMSRFLAQEAGRASSGPTGFDGRRGRLLPGPTVGN